MDTPEPPPLDESQFMTQFTGSASANLMFFVLFMLFTGMKKLCERHSNSKCHTKLHSCCCDIDLEDRTRRSENLPATDPGEA